MARRTSFRDDRIETGRAFDVSQRFPGGQAFDIELGQGHLDAPRRTTTPGPPMPLELVRPAQRAGVLGAPLEAALLRYPQKRWTFVGSRC
jgi:hypothetical protein